MQKVSRKNHEYAIKISNLYAGGLVVVDLVFLPLLLSSKPLDCLSQFALGTFSIALPILVGTLIINAVESYRPSRPPHPLATWLVYVLFLLGLVTNYIGFCIVIAQQWHPAGVLFILSTFVALVIYGFYLASLKEDIDA